MQTIPISKIIATIGGTAITGAAVWLNAEHVAATEGWQSPLVIAGIIVTLCAASAPPFAERAAKNGEPLKAATLWLFFALAAGFSLSASIARSSGYVVGKAATAERANEATRLAKEAYEAAKASQVAECVTGRGSRCRTAETALTEARKALATATPLQSADPGAERLAAVLGIEQSKVQLYIPLLLPLGLELGGFIFLAFGLAPARRREFDPNTKPTDEIASPEPFAAPAQEIATPIAAASQPAAKQIAKSSRAIANLATEVAKPAAVGTRAYYLARLKRELPDFASRVATGELSVFRASVQAGLRKEPAKHSKWAKANAYLNREVAKV